MGKIKVLGEIGPIPIRKSVQGLGKRPVAP